MKIEGKKVLITGAGGFIGSHLVERCVELGANVRAIVHYNSLNRWGWLDCLDKRIVDNIEVISDDVRDPNGVRSAVKGTSIILHLAALIGIPYSYNSPDNYVETNIKGTLNILQAARSFDVEKTIVTSTSEVYGTAKKVPIDEEHPRQPQSPYSATKIAADCLAESFSRSFGLPLAIVRPFNTYGPRQSARAIVPTIITQILFGKENIKLGSLHPTRDLVFVRDTVDGFIEIAKSKKTNGQHINIATNQEISMGELANQIVDIMNPKVTVSCDEKRVRPKDSEVERLLGDNRKIKELTNWKCRTSLEQGLAATIEWFKIEENFRMYKSELYNV